MRTPLTSVRFAQVMRVGRSWEKRVFLGDLKDAFQTSFGKQSGVKGKRCEQQYWQHPWRIS